jgi:hypothetical protein
MVNTLQSGRRRAAATRSGTTPRSRREALDLAASIDDAAAEMQRDGPVSPDELRRALVDLELEWANEPGYQSALTRRSVRPTR